MKILWPFRLAACITFAALPWPIHAEAPKVSTPIPLTADQNRAILVANQNVAIAEQGLALRKAEFKALLGEIAHAQGANADTHTMQLEEIKPGEFAFRVRPTDAPVKDAAPKK